MEKDFPPLSIVIPSHRRVDLLADCLRSVKNHAPDWVEVIVVDDGSADGAVSRSAACFAGIRVLRLEQNAGFCIAANLGIHAAKGRIVQLLNDDTLVTARWFETPMERFTDPKIGAVAPLVLLGTPEDRPIRIDSAGDDYDLGGFARKRGHKQLLSKLFARGGEVFGASGAAAFYRRSAIEAVGAFPEEFGAYFEDVDLSFRLRRAGYRIWYEPSSVVWHRCGASYGRQSRKLVEQQSLNEERVFWRNLTTPQLWRYLPRHIAVLVGKSIRRVGEGTLIPFLMGRARLLGGIREVLRYRQGMIGCGDILYAARNEASLCERQPSDPPCI